MLEGETLADRIARGPMPMGDVLRYGVQIAEALAKAHRSGIVHRDLKPANMSVAMPADPSTQPFGDPVVLFQTPLAPVSMTGLRNQYVATRDGQRFLLFESSNTNPSHLKLIQGLAGLVAD